MEIRCTRRDQFSTGLFINPEISNVKMREQGFESLLNGPSNAVRAFP